jgi:hypothetical protein
MRKFLLFILFIPQIFVKAQDKKLFSLLSPNETGVSFRNDIVEDGNMFYYKYEYLYIGAGVAAGDINNDGFPDLYFASTLGTNRLYLNLGNFQFKDITEQAGVGAAMGMKTGVNMIDINNDGWLDILVCKSGPTTPGERTKHLYINNGNLTFTDKAKEFGLNDASFSTQSYFFDYDKDGDMDVFFANQPKDFTTAMLIPAKMVNGKMVYAEDTSTVYVSDRLYRNDKGKFTDVTKQAGLINHAFALSAAIYDFNNDGWPDIYVANDFNKPDFLYINNKKGGFSENLSNYFNHVSLSSMGSDLNDINNDGLEDLLVLDMAIEDPVRQKQLFVQNLNYDKFQLLLKFNLFYQYPRNCLQLNNGNGRFSDIAYYSGMAQTDWSWTPLIADYDNDGWKDVYITNGLKRDITDWDYKNFVLDSIKNLIAKGQSINLDEWYKQIPQVRIKNYFYHNNASLKFENYSDTWCDQLPSFSNSAVYADLDNDGDLDLVVNNIDDPAFIYKNNSRELNNSNYLQFRFFKNKNSKEEVYGVMVKLYDSKNNLQTQRYDPQRGYMGTMEHFLHFGTGKEMSLPRVEIIFPSGKSVFLQNVNTNQLLTIYQDDANDITPLQKDKPLFEQNLNKSLFNYTHKENDFIDFKREPLIPYKCSRKGPYYSKADINGDGKEDIYIGGAAGFEAKLMMQMVDGSFKEKAQAAFAADKKFEDGGAIFFDADGDGDNDLYVTSGGAGFESGSPLYQDRLYINDGKGNFTKKLNALPKDGYNNSFVIAFDYDEDGDDVLFVGGAVMPGRFPLHDKNLILQNNKGIFKEVSDAIAAVLANTGIVNYATWNDIDGDKKNELIIIGEWMSPMILKFTNGKFEEVSSVVSINNNKPMPLNELSGWWNVVKANDIDNDGDMDLVVGNRGLNSKITADINEPCTVYAKDFDGNGSYDAVLGYYIWGKCYPMYHRDQLIDQMPMMRKKFIRYRNYAGKTLDEIFTDEQKKGMDVFKASCFESGVLINEGNLKFRFVAFPEQAQFSTINDLVIADLDGNGTNDILTVGNSYDPDVSTGNYDARAAQLLAGDGKGIFQTTSAVSSGLGINGEIRRIIYLQEKKLVILLKNNAPAEILRQN